MKAAHPYGRETTAMDVAHDAHLRGRIALVTGASSGLGLETAKALAAAGADLVLGVRNRSAGEAVAARIRHDSGRRVHVGLVDLSDLASVVAFSDELRTLVENVDVVVANAGVSKTPQSHLPNGMDVRFATNHLGHFLLVHRLHDQLASNGARVVVVSSAAHKKRPIRLDDLQWKVRPRNDLAAYGESKTANILFALEVTRRWSGEGIVANAVLPGSALTGLQRYHGDALMGRIGFIAPDGTVNPAVKSVEQGAATSVWAATAPELEGRGGLILEDCAEAKISGPRTHPWSGYDPAVVSTADGAALWERSLALLREYGVDT
jgi:NAD(P)-dependent dehydrogenase (short-subunit alcohol dehydrogenase family)